MTDERASKAKRYARWQRRLALAGMALFTAYAAAWIAAGLARRVGDALAARLPFPLDAVGMAVLFGGGWILLDLPLAFYGGFVLPHRFGLSTQTVKGWALDQAKGWGIGAGMGLPLLAGLYAAFRRWPETWWLPVGAFWILFTVLLAQWTPVLLAPLFYRFRPLEDPELVARLEGLARRAGLGVRGVFVIDMSRRTRAANAGLMGIGPTRRIVLGDTLLQGYTPEEIEAILAHELAHHRHRDLPIGLALGSAVNLLGFLLGARLLPLAVQALGFPRLDHPGTLPALALAAAAFGLATGIPWRAWSRWREWEADRAAIRWCSNPWALASALRKLGEQNLAEPDPEAWVEVLFHTHPALGKRIRAAEAQAAAMAATVEDRAPSAPPSDLCGSIRWE